MTGLAGAVEAVEVGIWIGWLLGTDAFRWIDMGRQERGPVLLRSTLAGEERATQAGFLRFDSPMPST